MADAPLTDQGQSGGALGLRWSRRSSENRSISERLAPAKSPELVPVEVIPGTHLGRCGWVRLGTPAVGHGREHPVKTKFSASPSVYPLLAKTRHKTAAKPENARRDVTSQELVTSPGRCPGARCYPTYSGGVFLAFSVESKRCTGRNQCRTSKSLVREPIYAALTHVFPVWRARGNVQLHDDREFLLSCTTASIL